MTISNYIEELIYRVLAGDASEEERCELEAWVRESEEHRVFFHKVERAWYTGKYAVRWKNVEMSSAWKAVEHKREARGRKRVVRIGWSVAAAVVLAVGLAWMFLPSGEENMPVAMVQAPVGKPGESKALLVLSSGERVALGGEQADTIRENGQSILREKDYIDYSREKGGGVTETVYN